MQDPDEKPEQPDNFAEAFAEALEKVSPEDFERIQQEALNEMGAEAMKGVPTPLYFPSGVIERIYAYEKEHSIDRNKMISMAIQSAKSRPEQAVKIMSRYLEDPRSFEWPIEDPILCVAIAFMQTCTTWITKKINQEYGDVGDYDDPADWWKEGESE